MRFLTFMIVLSSIQSTKFELCERFPTIQYALNIYHFMVSRAFVNLSPYMHYSYFIMYFQLREKRGVSTNSHSNFGLITQEEMSKDFFL